MKNRKRNDLVMITVPLVSFVLPSFETASTAAYLRAQGKNVRVEHLYIPFAESLGGEKYHFLRTSGIGEYIIASLLYPDQCRKIWKWYEKNNRSSPYDFYELRDSVKEIIKDQVDDLNIDTDVPVLFYLYSQQFVSALYYSRLIKEKCGCEIWFAGYHCNQGLVPSLRETFSFIDRIISENVEENVLALLNNDVPGEYHEDLDFLSTPDYDDYFVFLKKCGSKFREKFVSEPKLQVETSRGCWWGKCSFCTLNCKTNKFRERSIENVIKDYSTLIDKYDTLNILIMQFVNNKNWYELLSTLIKKYPGLKGAFDMNFKVASFDDFEELELLRMTGTSLLVGTENYDTEYLTLMNKGQTAIENIQFLKFAERKGVACYHNFMYGMPYETDEHLWRNKEVVELILHLIPPFDDEEFRLTFGSDIYKNPEKYGIREIKVRDDKEGIWFPKEVLKTYKPFFYDFVSKNKELNSRKKSWMELIEHWRKVYYSCYADALPKQVSLLQMFYTDKKLRIQDLRYGNKEMNYYFSGYEKSIYLFCDTIKSADEIYAEFRTHKKSEIDSVLDDFMRKKLMYSENEKYISLAI